MKKVFLTIICLFCMSSMSYASVSDDITSQDNTGTSSDIYSTFLSKKAVGIFLEAPFSYVDNETARKLVPEKAAELFELPKFKILPFDETSAALRTYQEDHRMIINEYYATPLNRDDIQAIGKELGLRYALFIKITNSAPRAKYILFTMTFKTTVTCDVRLLDIETAKYIVSKQIVKDGSSTMLAAFGAPDFNDAYNEALKKALKEINIDTSKL